MAISRNRRQVASSLRNSNPRRVAKGRGSRPLEVLEGRVLFATFTWDGGGGDANWMTAANWSTDAAPAGDGSDTLVFPAGAVQKVNNNNFTAGTAFTAITLQAGGYTLGGNGIELGATGVSDTSSTGVNTVSLPIAISTATTVSDSTGTTTSDALTLSGVVSGAGSVTRQGAGSVIFTGANTYSGGTTLSAGNTYANNSFGSAFGTGAVTNSTGSLRGNGSFFGALANNASLFPGATSGSTGALTMGGVNFGVGGDLTINVNGNTAGSGFDQLIVNGAVDLAGGDLNPSTSSFTPGDGEKLFILVNDGADAIVGTFNGLAQGATVEINSADYTISYTGNSDSGALTGGNDVVLSTAPAGPVNAAPVNTVPGTQTTPEDTAKVFSTANGNAITVTDSDAGSANVRTTLSVNNGATITLPSTSLVTAGASGSSTVTLTGSQTALTAALNGLSVAPAVNSNAAITLTVLTNDLGNTGSGGEQTATDNVTINVSAVNDAPVNTVPGTQTTATDTAKLFGPANSNTISVADPDATTLSVTLTATNGTLTLGATSGLTIDGGDSTDVTSVSFSGSAANINAGLINTTFTPDDAFAGAGSLQIVTSDGTLSDTDTVTINVVPPGTLAFSAATYTVGEGTGTKTATITVTRSGGTFGQLVANYETTTGGTATAGTDYTAVSTTPITFADGETSKTFTVPVIDDALDEDDETVNLVLSGASVSGQSTATLTIIDNEATPSVSIGDAVVVEGNAGTNGASFTVTLSDASGRTILVDYATANGTATAGSDFSTASGTLTFSPGQTTKTIMVNATGDSTPEADETFGVMLSIPDNGEVLPSVTIVDGTAAGIIADDDTAGPTQSVSIEQDITVTEGNSGTNNATFTVNLNGASGSEITVDYTVQAGTASPDTDYTPTSGTLTFTAGQTSKTVSIPVVGDTTDEVNETFVLVLSNPSVNATILDGMAAATIADNDAPPTVSIADASGIEGTGAPGSVEFTISLSAASGKPIVVALGTLPGTAAAGTDYTQLIDGTEVTFAPGETTKTYAHPTVGDALDEADETFLLTMFDSTLVLNGLNALVGDGQGVGTITDDDAPPTISVDDVTVAEPASEVASASATFTVTLSAVSGKTVTVDYATANGTATAGADYTAASGTLTFAPGETSKTITVPVLFDSDEEAAETFTVSLASPSNADLADDTGTGTIAPPNAAPVAADDVVMLAAGQASADVDVLANDTDADGDVLNVETVTTPAHGTATVNLDGTIRYTPAPGYSGMDSFEYTVMDAAGSTDTAQVVLSVIGNGTVVNPIDPRKTDLFVAGTAGNDQVQVVRVGKQIRVLINGVEQGTYTANGNVVISGGAGDDNLVIGKVKNAVLFNGGEGNDTLAGGGKNDILVGGPGNDTLNGGAGRDIIIGGAGADTLSGLGGADVLIAGTTNYDADTLANRAALNDLLTALAGKGKYAAKLATLTGTAGVGNSGARLVVNSTVFNDTDIDTLNGGGDSDFFAANTDGSAIDVLTKKAKNESVVEL